MSTHNVPQLLKSQFRILTLASEKETSGFRMDDAEKALAPMPAHETVSFLLGLDLIEEAVDRNGVKQKTRFVLSDKGVAVLEQYASGAKKVKDDPKEHAPVTPPGATKEQKRPPVKAAKGKGKAAAKGRALPAALADTDEG